MSALRGAQKAVAREYLISVLQESGHQITIEDWGKDPEEQTALSQVQKEIDIEDAQQWANSPTYETLEEAHKKLASECSLEDEIKALKTIECDRFPDVDFDDVDNCLWILIQHRGKLGRGAQLQAAIENIAAAKELDRESVETVCSNELGMAHRLPTQYVRAQLLRQSGILQLADRGVEFSNSDSRCIQVQQFAVKHLKQFRYYFGLTIAPEYTDSKGRKQHTPVDVCGKLLKKIGLQSVVIKTQGKRGAQERVYTVAIDYVKQSEQDTAWEYRDRALAAARQRLNLIVPVETDSPEPETEHRTEEKQSSETDTEQDLKTPYSPDFRRRAA
ncbi:hypothetical protein H6F51_14410 [Cyanobacteria bacterium FACHB-DQ100]|nr:hypothetical protein [Cyanobacteria bacterium FACHB-DQ100]